MLHLNRGRGHSEAQVFVRTHVRHINRLVLNVTRCYSLVLVDVEGAGNAFCRLVVGSGLWRRLLMLRWTRVGSSPASIRRRCSFTRFALLLAPALAPLAWLPR